MNKRWAAIAAGLVIAAGLSACGGAAKEDQAATPPQTADSGATVNAEALYKSNCLSCHGADLAGMSGPNLQHVGARLSTDQIAAKIDNGGAGMPAFKTTLKDTEVDALAEWLSAKK